MVKKSAPPIAPKPVGGKKTPEKLAPAAMIARWRRLLGVCGRKPAPLSVRALRVLTLRIDTRIAAWAAARPADPKAQKLAARWKKLGARLRRQLRTVRETDVFLLKLDDLKAPAAPAALKALGRLLRQVRREAVAELVAGLKKRGEKLDRLGAKAAERLTDLTLAATADEAAIRERVAQAAHQHPTLDAGSLHALRKQLKPARYLAEHREGLAGQPDPQAAALRSMLAAIGDWHDWEQLRLVAARLADRHPEGAGLLAALALREAQAYETAIHACSAGFAQILREPAPRPLE